MERHFHFSDTRDLTRVLNRHFLLSSLNVQVSTQKDSLSTLPLTTDHHHLQRQ